jgi:hypothetical protein
VYFCSARFSCGRINGFLSNFEMTLLYQKAKISENGIIFIGLQQMGVDEFKNP